ncbi:tRNA (adenosine(37)-N6)-threonylcarbamoyltransferase complex ATPase subunit type 1 TsaE [Candidatus Uhrbacteria bacterium]|nr:tRNA (adenosine(37)-N6)-threonylcarbamoyltransferase complex ATPase subunit type 1 TsaE [Candidatus Uhrbacteria bacterium]
MERGKTVRIADLDGLGSFAAEVSCRLRGGETIGLVGDLGAGKTAFVQMLARAMGITEAVRSPTFTLMQCYGVGEEYSRRTGIGELCHIDAYRLETADGLYAIGFGDYAGRKDAVTVIEWADRVEPVSRLGGYRRIGFGFGQDGSRILTVDPGLL